MASFSTTERPNIQEFLWLTGDAAKGNVPSGAKRLISLGDITGGWKVYLYGDGMERLLNAYVDVGQSAVIVTLDWYYVRDTTGNAFEDDMPNSSFSGTFDGAGSKPRDQARSIWSRSGSRTTTSMQPGRSSGRMDPYPILRW